MLLIWNMFNLFPTINSPKHVFIWLSSYFLFLQMCYLKFSVNEKQNKDFLFSVNVCSQMEFPSLVIFTFFHSHVIEKCHSFPPYSCLAFFSHLEHIKKASCVVQPFPLSLGRTSHTETLYNIYSMWKCQVSLVIF